MNTAIYIRQHPVSLGRDEPILQSVRLDVDRRGDLLLAVYTDDTRITGRGKNAGWRKLLADLGGIDKIVLADAGDLPGKTVQDLLSVLTMLAKHGVTIVVPTLGIDTSIGSAAVLDLIRAYRRAKRSLAIRAGQQKARQQGRHIGRPGIPPSVRSRIVTDLLNGAGVRRTGRRYNVSPGSVVAIRHEMDALAGRQAA